jgi:hypothetical protein
MARPEVGKVKRLKDAEREIALRDTAKPMQKPET